MTQLLVQPQSGSFEGMGKNRLVCWNWINFAGLGVPPNLTFSMRWAEIAILANTCETAAVYVQSRAGIPLFAVLE